MAGPRAQATYMSPDKILAIPLRPGGLGAGYLAKVMPLPACHGVTGVRCIVDWVHRVFPEAWVHINNPASREAALRSCMWERAYYVFGEIVASLVCCILWAGFELTNVTECRQSIGQGPRAVTLHSISLAAPYNKAGPFASTNGRTFSSGHFAATRTKPTRCISAV
jgi:hypothetical protein